MDNVLFAVSLDGRIRVKNHRNGCGLNLARLRGR